MPGGRHEVRTSDVSSRDRPRLAPPQLDRQAALLFDGLPRQLCGRATPTASLAVVRAERVRTSVRGGRRTQGGGSGPGSRSARKGPLTARLHPDVASYPPPYDATHWVKRCSISTMRSDSQRSSSLTDTAMLAA